MTLAVDWGVKHHFKQTNKQTKHRLQVLVITPRSGGSNVYPQSMFSANILEIFKFL